MRRELSGRQNGAAIRAIRKKDRRSVAEVARHVGLQPQSLRNIENGDKPASDEVIRGLADLLDVPINAITRDGTDCGLSDDEDQPEDIAA